MRTPDLHVVPKLLLAETRRHPARWALSAAAIVASASVVVWVVSGYDALIGKFDEFSGEYLGRYQLIVVPRELPDLTGFGHSRVPPLSPEVIESLRKDPQVVLAEPVDQYRLRMTPVNRPPSAPPLKSDDFPILVGTDASAPPYSMLAGRWIDSARPDLLEGAISEGAGGTLGLGLHDELIVVAADNQTKSHVRIVGIVEQPVELPPIDLRRLAFAAHLGAAPRTGRRGLVSTTRGRRANRRPRRGTGLCRDHAEFRSLARGLASPVCHASCRACQPRRSASHGRSGSGAA